jgi:hypothetical protein
LVVFDTLFLNHYFARCYADRFRFVGGRDFLRGTGIVSTRSHKVLRRNDLQPPPLSPLNWKSPEIGESGPAGPANFFENEIYFVVVTHWLSATYNSICDENTIFHLKGGQAICYLEDSKTNESRRRKNQVGQEIRISCLRGELIKIG